MAVDLGSGLAIKLISYVIRVNNKVNKLARFIISNLKMFMIKLTTNGKAEKKSLF